MNGVFRTLAGALLASTVLLTGDVQQYTALAVTHTKNSAAYSAVVANEGAAPRAAETSGGERPDSGRGGDGHSVGRSAALRAFPGAEGFGAYATGGRGGRVIHVTNLNNGGAGSFRHAVLQPGARTIVFDVGGIIDLTEEIWVSEGDLTIAGQAAPGDGVTIRGRAVFFMAPNIVVRYIRFRRGGEDIARRTEDAVTIGGSNVIIDHVSASWGTDETLSIGGEITNVTLQWSVMAEGLNIKGHGFGTIVRSAASNSKISVHHNLWAHFRMRLPNLTTEPGNANSHLVDFRNNVRYNWSQGSVAGHNRAPAAIQRINWVGNYSKSGPSLFNRGYYDRNLNLTPPTLVELHVNDNLTNGVDVGESPSAFKGGFVFKRTAFPVGESFAVTTSPPAVAFEQVLERAGVTVPVRDAVDTRVIADVRNGTGRVIDMQTDVGGWPALRNGTPPADSDRDGMPDAWEVGAGLNPANPSDRNDDRDGDGYTNLEEYLNGLVAGR